MSLYACVDWAVPEAYLDSVTYSRHPEGVSSGAHDEVDALTVQAEVDDDDTMFEAMDSILVASRTGADDE